MWIRKFQKIKTQALSRLRRIPPSACLKLPLLFAAAFLTGQLLARGAAALETSGSITEGSENWGLSFSREGERPTGNATIEELKEYNAYFAQDTDEKILYLTFDCGFENGNTPAILEALEKHDTPAAFFVVGNFVRDNPELIRQIADQGHIVANHTYSHPDMSRISTPDAFQEELTKVETLYKEVTGQEMPRYYRPPRGVYSTENLKMAKELGYQTFFWSLAYVDWLQEDQPSHEEAFEKLLGRIHPGAIVLLHNTSRTNGEILDELLTRWEEMGYRFGSLDDLTANTSQRTASQGFRSEPLRCWYDIG